MAILTTRFRLAIVLLVAVFGSSVSAGEPAAPFGLNLALNRGPSLGLDQLITLAIRQHPSIFAAQADLNAARFEIDAAQAQYWPTPSVQTQNDDKGDTSTVLALQQPLWAGGRLDAGLDIARSREDASRMALSDTQYTLALRVTAAWAAWLQAHGRMVALTDGIALLNVYADSVNRRIQGGAAGEVDRALVESRLAQLHGEFAAARSAERAALARLSHLTGQTLRRENLISPASASPAPAASAPLEASLEDLIAQAQTRAPALKRIAADIDAARHEATRKRAAQWPTLALRAQHQRGDAASTGSTYDTRVMLVLEYAPGAGLSVGAGINAAEARTQGLQQSLEAARRDWAEKVTNDYEERQSGRERAGDMQRTLQANTEVLASYDRLFVAGKRGWLDVINAARELIQARTSLADIEAQIAAAQARLRLHVGEGV